MIFINSKINSIIVKEVSIMEKVEVGIVYLDNYNLEEWGELTFEHEYDSGFDLRAAVKKPFYVTHWKPVIVPTGVIFNLPKGYEIQIRSRSGLAAKEGVFVLNSPGTIDAGYRGEVKVILMCSSDKAVYLYPGERIAQAVVKPVLDVKLRRDEKVINIDSRGSNGLGSTGKK